MSLFMGLGLAMAATWPKKVQGGEEEPKKRKVKRALQTCAECNENTEEIKRNRAIFILKKIIISQRKMTAEHIFVF